MVHKLILKIKKFQLSGAKCFGTVEEKPPAGWTPLLPPPPPPPIPFRVKDDHLTKLSHPAYKRRCNNFLNFKSAVSKLCRISL